MKKIITLIQIFSFGVALNYNVYGQAVTKTWEDNYQQAETIVNNTDSPAAKIKKNLMWSQFFAYFGVVAILACNNLEAIDVDLWAAGGVYYKIQSMILKAEEKRIINKSIAASTSFKKVETKEGDDAASITKKTRNNQVEHLENILSVQRDAIKLMKRQTNLLQTMTIIYAAALVVLIVLLVWGNYIGIKSKDLECKKQGDETIGKLTKQIMQFINTAKGNLSEIMTGFNLIKSFTFNNNNSKDYVFWQSEIQLLQQYATVIPIEEKTMEQNPDQKNIFDSIFNLLISSTTALTLEDGGDGGNTSGDGGTTDGGTTDGGTTPEKDSDTTKPTDAKVGDKDGPKDDLKGEKQNAAGEAITSVQDLIAQYILQPYVRIALYGVMGSITQFAVVNPNRKRIVAYEAKIADAERQLEELRGSVSKGLLAEPGTTATPLPTAIPQSKFAGEQLGCVKTVNNKMEYDPTCACVKTKTCTSFANLLPEKAPADVKNLISKVDEIFAGNSSLVNDQTKSDALLNQALTTADKTLNDVNQMRLSQGGKAIDFKGNIKKAVASLSNSKQLAKTTVTSKTTTAKNSKTFDDYEGGMNFGDKSSSKGGIVFREDGSKENIPLNDINTRQEESVFEVLSLRYQKSAYPKLLNTK